MTEDKAFERDVVTGRIAIQMERQKVVAFLHAEADAARHAQANARVGEPDKLYRMGQKDGLLIAANAIERGQHIPSAETPKGQTDTVKGTARP